MKNKRDDQYEFSAQMAFYSIIVITLCIAYILLTKVSL